jgi:hypothetical protein
VDKLTQEQAKISYTSGNSVCYYCADGKICNGSKTGIRMFQGMNVDVEVSLDRGIIDFLLFWRLSWAFPPVKKRNPCLIE